MKNAAEIAADQVNQAGGLDVGGRKYQVKVVAYDDKYQANEAVTVANRLVFEDKVKYIIGPVGSAPVLAIQPITEKNKVILMTLGFTSKALAADKPYVPAQRHHGGSVAADRLAGEASRHQEGRRPVPQRRDRPADRAGPGRRLPQGRRGTVGQFFERDRVDFVL